MVHAFRTSLSLAFAFAGFAACMASSRAQSLYTFAFPTNPPVVPVLQFDGTTRPAGSSPTFNRPVPNGASAPTLLSGLLTGYSAKTFVIPFADSYDCLCESGNPTDWAGGFFIYSGALDAPNPLTNCLAGDIGSDGTGHSVLRGLPLSPGTYTFVTTSAASGVFGSYAADRRALARFKCGHAARFRLHCADQRRQPDLQRPEAQRREPARFAVLPCDSGPLRRHAL